MSKIIQETKNLVAKLKLIEIFSKINNKTATGEDVKILTNILINSNPYHSFEVDKNIKIEFQNLVNNNESAMAACNRNNDVFVKNEILDKVANGDFSIMNYIEIIGHEMTHAEQNTIRDRLNGKPKLAKKVDEVAKNLVKRMDEDSEKETGWSREDRVKRIVYFTQEILPKYHSYSYFENYKLTTLDEKKKHINMLAFGEYVNWSFERDAHEGGENFVKIMFESLINDVSINQATKDFIMQDKEKFIPYRVEKEVLKKSDSFLEYEKYIKEISFDELIEISKDLNKGQYEIAERAFKYLVKEIYKEKPLVDLIEDVVVSMIRGSKNMTEALNSTLYDQYIAPKVSENEKNSKYYIREYILESFIGLPIKKGAFTENIPLDIFDKEHWNVLIKNYIDKNQFEYVLEILKLDPSSIRSVYVDKNEVLAMIKKNIPQIEAVLDKKDAKSRLVQKDLATLMVDVKESVIRHNKSNEEMRSMGCDDPMFEDYIIDQNTYDDIANMLKNADIKDFESEDEKRQVMQSVYSVEYANSVLGPKEPEKQITQNQVLQNQNNTVQQQEISMSL